MSTRDPLLVALIWFIRIFCHARVTVVFVSKGPIPAELGDLTDVQVLDFSDNELCGE